MKEAEISRTLSAHLDAAALGCPIIWPNKDAGEPVAPYLDFQIVRGDRPTGSLDGTAQRSEGYVQITVVWSLNDRAVGAEELADQVSDEFPLGQRITGTGGWLSIESSRVLTGFRDDVHWRVPVRINYRAFTA